MPWLAAADVHAQTQLCACTWLTCMLTLRSICRFLLFAWFTMIWVRMHSCPTGLQAAPWAPPALTGTDMLVQFTTFGITSVALTPNVKVAAVLSSNFYSLVNLFAGVLPRCSLRAASPHPGSHSCGAGFVAPRPQVPGWWVWMSWLCPTAYTLEVGMNACMCPCSARCLTVCIFGTGPGCFPGGQLLQPAAHR